MLRSRKVTGKRLVTCHSGSVAALVGIAWRELFASGSEVFGRSSLATGLFCGEFRLVIAGPALRALLWGSRQARYAGNARNELSDGLGDGANDIVAELAVLAVW
ncbi:hypothetical protein HYQ46_001928 [Verticillium longisporum]|nr:hypothetical protein HYQ46_001928 [Verticillium longisporum]